MCVKHFNFKKPFLMLKGRLSSHSHPASRPTVSMQPFDVESAHHDDKKKFTMCIGPVPLYFLCKGKQWLVHCNDWCLSSIQMVDCGCNNFHGMFYHCYRVCIVQ